MNSHIKTYVTLCRHNAQRVSYVNKLQNDNPGIKKFYALEGRHDWEEIDKLFEYFQIPVYPWAYIARDGGKISRWATVIMSLKYIYDLNIKDRVVVLEDDIWLGKDFNFLQGSWPAGGSFIKLSMWGEMYACGVSGTRDFFKKMYETGIDRNNDMWICDNNIYTDRFLLNEQACNKGQYKLLCPTNDGLIKRTQREFNKPKCFDKTWILNPREPCRNGNKLQGTIKLPANPSKIFKKKIFHSINDTDFKEVISRL